MISKKQMLALFQRAQAASANTYSPYSKFPVGSAVLTGDGSVYLGANVENASYGLTICAERVAICNAVASGKTDILAVAVYAKTASVTPCGACRQFIAEFGETIEVIYARGGEIISSPISDLLPGFPSRKELGK